MSESHTERTVNTWAGEQGISHLKLNGTGDRGKADQLYMKNGKSVFVEYKAKGEEPTKLQLRFRDQRRADGFAADWFDSVVAAKRFLINEFEL